MIQIDKVGEEYQIRFRYNPELITEIKLIPGKAWNPDLKCWTLPIDKLGLFLNQLKGTQYEKEIKITSDENIGKDETFSFQTEIPEVDISNIPFYIKEGFNPMQHQLEFMKYAIDRQNREYRTGFLCADEQGLGKTLESINLAIYNRKALKVKRCLIICNVNSSKYNWSNEVSAHTNGKFEGYLLGTRKVRRRKTKVTEDEVKGSKEKLEDLKTLRRYGDKSDSLLPFFIITNIESLGMKQGRLYPISDRIIELINDNQIGMIVIDEIHKNSSPTSHQGKQLMKIYQKTKGKCIWLPLTGTPIVNTPLDCFLPMMLSGAHNYKSYYDWSKHFCVYGGYGSHEVIAYKNISELKLMMSRNMIRRTKDQALDLPDKIYFNEFVDNTAYQRKMYEDVTVDLLAQAGEISQSLNPMTKFLRLRQVNGSPEIIDSNLAVDDKYIRCNAKLTRLLEILEDIHERKEKVVIFSNWVEPLRTLYRYVASRYKVCCFTGSMKEADRQKHKQVFMTNPEYTVMLGTIGALGTTHTLTAANNIIFYDEPWTYTDKAQAEDRCHRIGTKSSVNIYTILTRNTVDERVHDIVYEKRDTAGFIVDGKLDFKNNPDLVYKLLGQESR